MAHEVFISYSSRDKNTADAVCAALERHQIRCWVASRDVTPGQEWGEAIVDAIGGSRIMVLIFSAAANRSQQVLREVERAVNKNVIIVPFRIEDILPTRSMEYFLFSTHWLDALSPDLEKHIDRLVETVGGFLNHPVETARSPLPSVRRRSPIPEKLGWFAAGALILIALIGLLKFNGIRIEFGKDGGSSEVATQGQSRPREENGQAGTRSADVQNDKSSNGTSETASGNGPSNGDSAGTTSLSGPSSETGKAPKIALKIGDYIRFGNYNGEAIGWRVVQIDADGSPLLLATNVIDVKPFDAAESGTLDQMNDGRKLENSGTLFPTLNDLMKWYTSKYTLDELRQMKGSNYWVTSNLRDWLNSGDKRVRFVSQPPVKAAVGDEDSAYDNEPGFLYGFTEQEKSLIRPATHKVVLPVLEKDRKNGGNAVYTFSRGRSRNASENYDQSYYQNVTDRVFLLSVKEVADYLTDRGWDLRAAPSVALKDRGNIRAKYYPWTILSPEASTSFRMFMVLDEPDFVSHYNASFPMGVRPALYLTSSKLVLAGSGSETDPYVLK